MAELLQLRGVAHHAGPRVLFSGLDLVLESRDRVGLIGPNGAGKTTLLRLLAELEKPQSGERTSQRGLRCACMEQDPHFDAAQSARDFLLERFGRAPGPPPGRDAEVAATRALDRAGLKDPEVPIERLSGGWRRRLAAVAELATEPDLLLLDEPTNHLDLEGIEWLEGEISRSSAACVVISHDRLFLENLSTRIVEIDPRHPGGALVVDGTYSDYLERRESSLARLQKRQENLATLVREDIRYLRQGPKARTSKSASRVARAHGNIAEYEAVQRLNREVSLEGGFRGSGRQTKRLLVAEGLELRRGERDLAEELDLVLGPGQCLGVVGPNGSGKSTLLQTLLGEFVPTGGEVRAAPLLRRVYFDQKREQLDEDGVVARALSPEGDTLQLGRRQVHVKTWARQLGFRDDQLLQPVRSLSGGERARVLIGRLMSREADVLLLDEPTNDLDLPTLEMLERSLLEFEGAVVLVTHDRFLLDRVCTSLLALSGEGDWALVADREQWASWRRQRQPAQTPSASPPKPPSAASRSQTKRRKLSYHEQREADGMEERILEAEEGVTALEAELSSSSDPALLADLGQRLKEAQEGVDRLYARWSQLEARQQGDQDV